MMPLRVLNAPSSMGQRQLELRPCRNYFYSRFYALVENGASLSSNMVHKWRNGARTTPLSLDQVIKHTKG